jgi:lipopolysaccharide biosynthesis glycosyltransferase
VDGEIDLGFGFDGRYAPHAAALIASIIRYAPTARMRFIILCEGVSANLRSKVEMIAPNARFAWIEVKDEDLPCFTDRGHFNRTILFRLGLENLAPADCRRILYLDSDLIALSDIGELWNVDLETYPIGAVADAYVDPVAFAHRWQLSPPSKYFNSGVLLIDLQKVRAGRMFSAAIEFLKKNGRDLLFSDQDALNWVFWNQCHFLEIAWNVQRHMVIASLERNLSADKRLGDRSPLLVHYTGPEKPWQLGGYHPWAWLYWDNLARTPFAVEVAKSHGVRFHDRLRLWVRWLRRHPRKDHLKMINR